MHINYHEHLFDALYLIGCFVLKYFFEVDSKHATDNASVLK